VPPETPRGPALSTLVVTAVDYIDRFETRVKGQAAQISPAHDGRLRYGVGAMSAKRILIAHRTAAVRDRFAVALADARHDFVMADDGPTARRAVADVALPVDLAIVDLGLSDDPIQLLETLRATSPTPLALVVFSGSVRSAAEIPRLAGLNVAYLNEHAGTAQILPALAPLLFPDNFNRRTSTRMAISVPVTYRSGDTLAGAVTLDVGKGGLAIRTMTPLAKGTAVHVRFRLPGMPDEIDATGHVAWSDRKVGMGVQFAKLAAGHQRAIDGFVDEHAARLKN
jgi:uncharacterized protein (TIGR02266 family)